MNEEHICNKFINGMGNELGTLFFTIQKELLITTKKWEEYKDLFSTKGSRIDLMKKSAPLFFTLYEDSLVNDVLQSISRITDPPHLERKYKNASLGMILSLIKEKELYRKVAVDINSLNELVKSVRHLRDKKISHIDYETLLNQQNVTVNVDSKNIEDSLQKAHDIFNTIEDYFCKSKTVFSSFPSMGGAYELLRIIDLGLELEKMDEQKLRSGEYSMKDIKNRDI